MDMSTKMMLLLGFMFLITAVIIIALAWMLTHDTNNNNGNKPYRDPEDQDFPPEDEPEKAVDRDGHFLN